MNYRAIAEAMSAEDARDYLLDVIERERPPLHNGEPWPGVLLSPSQARILSVIASGKGKVVSNNAIFSAVYFDRLEADYPGNPLATLRVLVTFTRRKLPEGVHIVSAWGWGYRLELRGDVKGPWA